MSGVDAVGQGLLLLGAVTGGVLATGGICYGLYDCYKIATDAEYVLQKQKQKRLRELTEEAEREWFQLKMDKYEQKKRKEQEAFDQFVRQHIKKHI